jgi:hypothetical protein
LPFDIQRIDIGHDQRLTVRLRKQGLDRLADLDLVRALVYHKSVAPLAIGLQRFLVIIGRSIIL